MRAARFSWPAKQSFSLILGACGASSHHIVPSIGFGSIPASDFIPRTALGSERRDSTGVGVLRRIVTSYPGAVLTVLRPRL